MSLIESCNFDCTELYLAFVTVNVKLLIFFLERPMTAVMPAKYQTRGNQGRQMKAYVRFRACGIFSSGGDGNRANELDTPGGCFCTRNTGRAGVA